MRTAAVIAVATLISTASFAAPTLPPACNAPENHQFDFWVGRWDVSTKAAPTKIVARSFIEEKYNGCAVRENWMPNSHLDGGSLSTYVPVKKIWRQFWVDSGNGAVDFTGRWDGKSMILTGEWPQPGHPHQLTRMTYTKLTDGSVEQVGVSSDNGGKTWQPSFDFLYHPAHSNK